MQNTPKKINTIREKRRKTNRFISYLYASRLNYQPLYLSTNLQLPLKLLTGTRRKGKRRTGIARGTSREMPQGTPWEYLGKRSGLPLQNSSLIFSLSLHGVW